jgi:hypothetical protein
MALTKITKGVIKPGENYDTHNINSTGVITATSFYGDGTNLTGIDAATLKSGSDVKAQAVPTGVVVTGVLTASSFSGDGSNLTGVSGFADAQGRTCGMDQVFTTPMTITLGGSGCGINTIEASTSQGGIAFVRAKNITIGTGIIHIKTGTTVKTNVLDLF